MKKKDNNKEKVDRFGLMMAHLGVTLRSIWRKFGAIADTIIRLWWGIARAIRNGWRWWWNNTFFCTMSILLIISGIFVGVCVLGAKCNESEIKRRTELYEKIEADWTVNDTSFVNVPSGAIGGNSSPIVASSSNRNRLSFPMFFHCPALLSRVCAQYGSNSLLSK